MARYHSRQKRNVICSRAFLWGSFSEGAGEADMVAMSEGAVARAVAERVGLDAPRYLVAIDVSLVLERVAVRGCMKGNC